ncbi:MAG: fec operon regulator FecR [Mucilaginibacter sp.]|nr:fec operon regulator FecR [Mucilaginibacter sp.]
MDEKQIKEALRIIDLVARYLNAQLSSDEAVKLNEWINRNPENRRVFEQLINENRLESTHAAFHAFDTPAALQKVKFRKLELRAIKVQSIWSRPGILKYAAAALLILSIGAYFFINKRLAQSQNVQIVKNDLSPGSNKAILTLSNGKKISLTDAKPGIIASDANLVVKKNTNGSINYENNTVASEYRDEPAYQTITTPRGGQWPQIELPDGTKVTLDAGSSITYPVVFSGSERRVAVTGQVYFSVKHNAAQPFRVTVKDQIIEDIGTEFNINAFDDETAVRTTLIEGSVSVSKNKEHVVLTPGQQAVDRVGNEQIRLKEANLAEVIAWKNGLFHFDHADLKTVMRQVSRWYDVQVFYEGQIPKTDITGEVYRSMKASQVFEVLNNLKVNFRIDGKKIIVTDKN